MAIFFSFYQLKPFIRFVKRYKKVNVVLPGREPAKVGEA